MRARCRARRAEAAAAGAQAGPRARDRHRARRSGTPVEQPRSDARATTPSRPPHARAARRRRSTWSGYLAAAGLAGKHRRERRRAPAELPARRSRIALLASAPLATWKAYARTCACSTPMRSYLGQDFVSARFDFSGTALRGTTANEPRWQRGIALVDESSAARRSAEATTSRSHFPPAKQGAHGAAGRQPDRRVPREHRFARLDERGDQARTGVLAKLGDAAARRSATRPAGSTTARSRSGVTTWSATSPAPAPSSTSASSPSSARRSTATNGGRRRRP